MHVTSGDAEIRVTFEGVGNWSALGTDALLTQVFPPDAPTLCLSELPSAISSSRVDRLARHEFGHALGLIHEHSSPAAGIRWDRETVYAALAQPPNSWTREQVDHNVFQVYDRTTTNFTEFDPESVMLYAFPAEWTLDGVTFPENSTLSQRDEDFVRTNYADV
ncbi:Astacin (Peptidase family M12A) [Pseudonocardia oroxyli]|uniref:Astacin (Peptidase family M12A) n=1 Tax=Pseudonocardia oroxyli TaxID=366584 RepID=A0A1G7XCT0_PSEOR|nr:Astacin (Peptidase family M12A) [Pseudonocardia oroxyli]